MLRTYNLYRFRAKKVRIVEKKQLNVLFLQIVVDIGIGSGYYGFIVIRKGSKRLLRKTLAINIF
jgi:hypothetical protein